MAQTKLKTPSITRASFIKCLLMGAGIGFILIAAFLFSAGEGNPEWGNWLVKPLIIVPFAGSVGGAFYYFMTQHFIKGGRRILATVISVIVFFSCLWIGTVLGLNGTYWN